MCQSCGDCEVQSGFESFSEQDKHHRITVPDTQTIKALDVLGLDVKNPLFSFSFFFRSFPNNYWDKFVKRKVCLVIGVSGL